MELPDGTVLMHAGRPYDAQKAHAYYLRTRQLKGRQRGAGVVDSPPPPVKGTTVKPKVDPKKLAEQKAAIAKRVTEIRGKLAELERRLKEAMADAREAETKAKRGPTAADKAESARDSKKYRDSHKQELKSKEKKAADTKPASDKPKADTVESLQKTISEVKGRLAAAVDKQRKLNATR